MLTTEFNLWLLIGLALWLSLTINLLFIFKELARKFPNVFYEPVEEE